MFPRVFHCSLSLECILVACDFSHCSISVSVIVIASFRGQGRANCNQQKGRLRFSHRVDSVTSYYWTRHLSKTVYKERLIFRLRFERFLFIVSLFQGKNITTERHGVEDCSPHSSQEARGARDKKMLYKTQPQ